MTRPQEEEVRRRCRRYRGALDAEGSTHLVGHSYGGVIALLAAARCLEAIRSLTVTEPPAFGLVRGQPEVEDWLAYVAACPTVARGAPTLGSAHPA